MKEKECNPLEEAGRQLTKVVPTGQGSPEDVKMANGMMGHGRDE